MFFIGIFGITQKEYDLDYEYSGVCEKCGEIYKYEVIVAYNCFHFFFIPIFKWGRKYYAHKMCCDEYYEINEETGKQIEKGNNVILNHTNMNRIYIN